LSKKRYIVLRFKGSDVGRERLSKLIEDHLNMVYGLVGSSKVNPEVVYFNRERLTGVVRTTVEGVKLFRAMLALVGPLEGVHVRVVKVTGTLRKAKAIAKSI